MCSQDDDETLQEQIQNIRANLRRDSPDNAGSSENLVGSGWHVISSCQCVHLAYCHLCSQARASE